MSVDSILTDTRSANAVEEELAGRFPDEPRAVLHTLVQDAFESLAHARIRDFVPLLARRIVSERVAAERRRREEP
ncbi:MAG TPA: hypothetical protein VMI11_11050 [Actinomycetes bacterium]|nr:hypothetical protein [Actinomycetes bacterium]